MSTQDITRPTLILGANGRIGQALRHFAPESWQERLRLQRRSPADDSTKNGADWRVFAPLTDPEALRAAATGCGHILCLAGSVPGRGDLEDNARLAIAAVEAAADAGCGRVILTSSAAVYGRSSGPLREDQPLRPANAYGEAKVRMEEAGRMRADALGVAVCALRIGNVAGFDAILGGWKPGFTLDQFPDGTTPRRSYIGVQALAQVICDLMEAKRLPPALNVAQLRPIEMGELLTRADLEFATRPAPADAISDVTLDLTLLQSCLNTPVVPACGISLVAQWHGFCQ
ncbi:NAD(P)-dependent oxidoreductase [Epibacterium ulvae]|uniref:NAD-dependent epimerase/dehydratase family protein n=1 Tax=Epibacterium ulvae TaxID=1156985 RepID=UPI001BFBF774|nr:NAD(P)-dependent oxidoreductase [Epibacterium ulvae]MBT8154497.1 NAD(P)-dependent oxidoreductase [Epibacterium ulvae]